MGSPFWSQRWLSSTGRSIQRTWNPSLHPGQSWFGPNYWQMSWTSILSNPSWGKEKWPVLPCRSDGCIGYFLLIFSVPNVCPHADCPSSHKPVCSQLLSVSPRCTNGKHDLPQRLSTPLLPKLREAKPIPVLNPALISSLDFIILSLHSPAQVIHSCYATIKSTTEAIGTLFSPPRSKSSMLPFCFPCSGFMCSSDNLCRFVGSSQ